MIVSWVLTYDPCAGTRKGHIAHATVRAAVKWFDDGPPCTQGVDQARRHNQGLSRRAPATDSKESYVYIANNERRNLEQKFT